MLKLNKKLITYMLVLSLFCLSLSGCNRQEAANEETVGTEEQAGENDASASAVSEALSENAPAGQNTSAEPASVEGTPVKVPVGDKSPVAITRIDVDNTYPTASASGEATENMTPQDDHDHEPAENLFPIDECLVEINGIYKVALAKDLLKEINSRRKDYGIPQLRQNTSLLACADGRCKEQTYFVGHFRPDGRPFTSISPNGEVRGECIAVDYRTVNDIMEAWFSVNKSRMEIMNPDYTQCGISIYDIDNIYYIAAEFSY